MDTGRALMQLARDNDGIVTRKDLVALGLSASAIDRRIAAGLLVPLFPGVYRIASHPDTYRARVRAAWRWGGDGALLCGGTVLSLMGLEGFDEPAIELYRSTGKSAPGIRVRRLPACGLPRRGVAGMMGTSLERALLDACRNYHAPRVGTAMDDALRRKLTTVARLRAAIPADPRGIKGAKAFARLVRARDLNDQVVRSEMEARMLKILRSIKGYQFVPNFEVRGKQRYFLDFAYPHVRLGIECHSRKWHMAERANSDTARHNDLQALGWTIFYFTWGDLVYRPHEVRRQIEEFLAARSLPT